MFIFWIIGAFLLVSAVFFIRAAIGYGAVTRDGKADFEYRRNNDMLTEGLSDEAQFIARYRKIHGPRGALYAGAGFALAGLLTYPLLGLLVQVFEYSWRWGGQSRAFEPGYLVWQFMLFAGMIIGYALIAWLTARQYHKGHAQRLDKSIKGVS